MPDTIVKLVYRRDYFDVATMSPGAKDIITITSGGLITEKAYGPRSRKAHSVKKAECTAQEFTSLCERLVECIETADRLDGYCDDSSEELTIYHQYGRIQTMDRGLGNENIHIGEVMNRFLEKYLSN